MSREDIRDLLARFGCLTTGQIYLLLGLPRAWYPQNAAQRSVRQILKRGSDATPPLWFHGALFKGRLRGRPQTENVYWLGPKERRPRYLAHDVLLSEAHIALGLQLPWRKQGLCGDGINPDALFFLPNYFFFVELERQRNGFRKRSSCVRKAERYVRFRQTGNMAKHSFLIDGRPICMRDFYVLFVFADDPEFRDSAVELRDNALLKFAKDGLTHQRFKLATLADIVANPYGEIWRSPNGEITSLC